MKIDQSLPLEYSTQQNQLNILGFWCLLVLKLCFSAHYSQVILF